MISQATPKGLFQVTIITQLDLTKLVVHPRENYKTEKQGTESVSEGSYNECPWN